MQPVNEVYTPYELYRISEEEDINNVTDQLKKIDGDVDTIPDFNVSDNPHIGILSVLYLSCIDFPRRKYEEAKADTDTCWNGRENMMRCNLRMNYFALAFAALCCLIMQLGSVYFISDILIHRPPVRILCDDWTFLYGWCIGWIFVFSRIPFMQRKINRLRFDSCVVVGKSWIAISDLVLEFFFEYFFGLTSLVISLFYSEAALGFLLNAVIVSWISNLDNEFAEHYFSFEEKQVSRYGASHGTCCFAFCRSRCCSPNCCRCCISGSFIRLKRGAVCSSPKVRFCLYLLNFLVQCAVFGFGGYGLYHIGKRQGLWSSEFVVTNKSCPLV